MRLGRALLALHRTGRVYKDDTTLIDRLGNKVCSTLLPRDWDSTGLTPLVPQVVTADSELLGAPELQEPAS